MIKINRLFTLCSVVMLAVFASPLRAGDSCNPVVDPVASDTTLQRTLSRLADEYEFKLSLPESLDRPVNFEQSMALDRLVKHLTRDMNTILKHKKVDGCDKPVLSQLIVLPVGKESGYVGNQQAEQEQPVEYIYIEDMESYVTSVLEGKQQADLGRMTPEQQEEFKMVRDALAARAAGESSQTGDASNTGDRDPNATGQAPANALGN